MVNAKNRISSSKMLSFRLLIAFFIALGISGCKKKNQCDCENAFKNTVENYSQTGVFTQSKWPLTGNRSIGFMGFTPNGDGKNDSLFPTGRFGIDTTQGNERYFNTPIILTYQIWDGNTLLFSKRQSFYQYTYTCCGSPEYSWLKWDHALLSWDGGNAAAGHYKVVLEIELYDGSKLKEESVVCLVRDACCGSKSFYSSLPYIDGYDDFSFFDPVYARENLCK
jgi:hypothetical protein